MLSRLPFFSFIILGFGSGQLRTEGEGDNDLQH